MTVVDTDKLRLMATLQQWVHEPFVTDAANEIDALRKRLEAAEKVYNAVVLEVRAHGGTLMPFDQAIAALAGEET